MLFFYRAVRNASPNTPLMSSADISTKSQLGKILYTIEPIHFIAFEKDGLARLKFPSVTDL